MTKLEHVTEAMRFYLDQPEIDLLEMEVSIDPFGIGIYSVQMSDGSQYVVFRDMNVKEASFSAWPPTFKIIS
jgi:hypothetical protein